MIKVDNLIFLEPISIRLPSELYDLIEADARLFGYRKNGKGNINGFLNELIPSIIDVQENTSTSIFFLNEDKETDALLNRSLFCIDCFFKTLLKGNNVTISFRVNKAHEKEFKKIYEDILPAYNMDFSAILRSLLTFYITNRLALRERFLHFENYKEISNAIIQKKQCLIFLKEEMLHLSSMAIFVSPTSDRNVLLGINQATGSAVAFPFHLVETAIIQNEDSHTSKNDYNILRKAFLEYLKIEKQSKNH